MTTPPADFVAVTDRNITVKEILSRTGAVTIGWGAPEQAGRMPDAVAAQQADQAGEKTTIIPIGEDGAALWSRLSLEVGLRAAPPHQHAIVIAALQTMQALEADRPAWQWALEQIGNVRILPPLEQPSQDTQLPELAPATSRLPDWLDGWIGSFPQRGEVDRPRTAATQAGLLLMHDELDRCHNFSQSLEGQGTHHTGDYWHAIMHRREPDYGNAKYWFRRVGEHPLFPELADRAKRILSECSDPRAPEWMERLTRDGWNAMAFVDCCEENDSQPDSHLGLALRRIQWIEMVLLLEATTDPSMDL